MTTISPGASFTCRGCRPHSVFSRLTTVFLETQNSLGLTPRQVMDSTAARYPGHTTVTKKLSEPHKKPPEPSATGRTFFISALEAETHLNFCKLSHQSARAEKLIAIATKHTITSRSGETEQQLLQKHELNFSSKKREPW